MSGLVPYVAAAIVVPYIGAAIVVYFIYQAYQKSSISGSDPPKSGARLADPGMPLQYQEVDDAQRDTLNLTSNLAHIPVVRTEVGEFGNPRVIYEGASSNIVTYGPNYRKY